MTPLLYEVRNRFINIWKIVINVYSHRFFRIFTDSLTKPNPSLVHHMLIIDRNYEDPGEKRTILFCGCLTKAGALYFCCFQQKAKPITNAWLKIIMKIIISLAILLAVAAWATLGLTFSNLLSGNLEERSCLTDCVKNYYFVSAGTGMVAAALALLALFRARFASWSFLLLIVCGMPFAVVAGIFTIGTLGTMPH